MTKSFARSSLLAFSLLSSLLLTGCGSQATTTETASFQGKVDEALAPEDKVRQSALARLLRAFQDGVIDESDLQFSAGDIQLVDGVSAFYGSYKRLYRWEFQGSPKDSSISVKLTFDNSEGGGLGSDHREELRTYSVNDNGYGFSIQRLN